LSHPRAARSWPRLRGWALAEIETLAAQRRSMHAAEAGPGGQSEQCVFGSGRRLGHCASASARRVASSVLRICGQPPHGLQVPVALETTQSASFSHA